MMTAGLVDEFLAAIKEQLGEGWHSLVYYLTLQFLDPFWWWLGAVVACYVVVTGVCAFLGFYFPSMPGSKTLRTIGGVFLVVITFGLWAYAKGERDARAHDKASAPKPKPRPLPPRAEESPPFRWPWRP